MCWKLPDAENHGRIKHCCVVHWNGIFRLKLWRYRLIITYIAPIFPLLNPLTTPFKAIARIFLVVSHSYMKSINHIPSPLFPSSILPPPLVPLFLQS
jgi:hypothetical protein